jgi:hypothetical protein
MSLNTSYLFKKEFLKYTAHLHNGISDILKIIHRNFAQKVFRKIEIQLKGALQNQSLQNCEVYVDWPPLRL